MTKPISKAISDPDMWEQFSDDLERYLSQASSEINNLGDDEKSANSVYEILMSTIYIPIMMGEDKTVRKVTKVCNE